MKIIDAIAYLDELKPNGYSTEMKIGWLSTLDGMVKKTVIDTHEDGEDIEFAGYDKDTDTDTVLLVPAPFDDIYLYWLQQKVELANGEYAKYNNSAMRFNDIFSEYRNWYNSQHMPKTAKINYF